NIKMDLKYLKHLAKRGAPYIHPKGRVATSLLIENLDLRSGEKLLEVGCGTGATLCEIASRFDVKIEGIDILDEMINAANERIEYLKLGSKAKVKLYSPEKQFPYENASFDKVYAESVLGFQENTQIEFLIKEIYRVLKPAGTFVINEAFWKENTHREIVTGFTAKVSKAFGLSHASPSGLTKNDFISSALNFGFINHKSINLSAIDVNPISENDEISRQIVKFNWKKKVRNLISLRYLLLELRFRKEMASQTEFSNYIEAFIIVFHK